MSVTCLNQSDRGKECSSSCVSCENTLGTRLQCNHSGVQDQLSTDSIQQDDEVLHDTDCLTLLKENSLPTSFGKQYHPQSRKPKPNQRGLEHGTGSRNQNLKNRKRHTTIEPFDICYSENEESPVCQSESDSEDFVFGRSSEEEDDDVDVDVEDNSQEDRPSEECRHRVLRPGMVLLKKYISRTEQISIVRKCRQLGLGRGGFYRPGYNDGAKLRLHMMCLGMDWDPQTRKYQKQRRIDRAKPPDIPSEFHLLVNRAMQYSLALTRRHYKVTHAEEILPQVTPDVCIVNFYNETGRLGLHQDRDESTESLSKRLPVVSFSVGNAAEFLYGDQRDVNKANKLVLESGDVLVFGGESRHIFHGITSIIPDSAPGFLQKEIKLCPGRLNLTFRKY